MMKPRLFLYLLTFLPPGAPAQDTAWTTNVFLENDLFADTDLNYTNGLRLSLVSPDLSDYFQTRERTFPWVNLLNRWLEPLHPNPKGTRPEGRNITVSLAQLMFTPEDKTREDIDPDDRPYAGWLYTGLGYHARSNGTLHSMELQLGVVGPASLAHQSQDLVHEVRGLDKFQGWENQLKNEPGLQLVFERKHRNGLFGGGPAGRPGRGHGLYPRLPPATTLPCIRSITNTTQWRMCGLSFHTRRPEKCLEKAFLPRQSCNPWEIVAGQRGVWEWSKSASSPIPMV